MRRTQVVLPERKREEGRSASCLALCEETVDEPDGTVLSACQEQIWSVLDGDALDSVGVASKDVCAGGLVLVEGERAVERIRRSDGCGTELRVRRCGEVVDADLQGRVTVRGQSSSRKETGKEESKTDERLNRRRTRTDGSRLTAPSERRRCWRGGLHIRSRVNSAT